MELVGCNLIAQVLERKSNQLFLLLTKPCYTTNCFTYPRCSLSRNGPGLGKDKIMRLSNVQMSYLDPNEARNLCSDFNFAFLHDIISSFNFLSAKMSIFTKKKKIFGFLVSVISDLD